MCQYIAQAEWPEVLYKIGQSGGHFNFELRYKMGNINSITLISSLDFHFQG